MAKNEIDNELGRAYGEEQQIYEAIDAKVETSGTGLLTGRVEEGTGGVLGREKGFNLMAESLGQFLGLGGKKEVSRRDLEVIADAVSRKSRGSRRSR